MENVIELRKIDRLLTELKLTCGRLKKGHLNYKDFYSTYHKQLAFLKNIRFPEFIDQRINLLPHFPKPSLFTQKPNSEYFLTFGIYAPYVSMILIVITAPISIPLLILNTTRRQQIQANLEESIEAFSSISFLMKHPAQVVKPMADAQMNLLDHPL